MIQKQSLQARQELRHFLRMEQATVLEMPEEEFQRLIAEMEKSLLFHRLFHQEGIIRYQRLPKADLSPRFYELKEELVADSGSLDLEELLQERQEVVEAIKGLGVERFKRYFLYPEPGVTAGDVARECDLEPGEVERINELVDRFSVMSEFFHPSGLGSPQGIHYSKIASVERGPDGFIIGYFAPSLARGRYSIDYERFERLAADGFFSSVDAGKIRQLLRKLELINSRKDTLHRILVHVVEKQALYLESGDQKALLPFTQRELAQKIAVAPSSVSRAIRGKSVDTPSRAEKPLKDFFPRPRRFRRELVRHILEAEDEPISDERIKGRLEEEFGVSLSRRTISSLRKELKIPAARHRG